MQENKEIMSWLKNTWTKHQDNWITVAGMMPPVKRNGKRTPDILQMDKKEYLTNWNKSTGWYEARTMNLQEDGQELEGKLFFGLQMMTRNTTKITEILRENEKQRGWSNNEKNLKAILEKACDWWNSFFHHTWKEFENNPGRIRRVR